MTWLRRVLTWRPSWAEPGHWCGACQLGVELEEKFAAYRVRMSYLNQPVREALPLDEYQRDAEIRKLETWAGR